MKKYCIMFASCLIMAGCFTLPVEPVSTNASVPQSDVNVKPQASEQVSSQPSAVVKPESKPEAEKKETDSDEDFQIVGRSGFHKSEISNDGSIALNNSNIPYIAFIDRGTKQLQAMTLKNQKWVPLGSYFPKEKKFEHMSMDIAPDGSMYISAADAKVLYIVKYSSGRWIRVGEKNLPGGYKHSLKVSKKGIPYIAYIDKTSRYKLTVKKFDGSNWVNVGKSGFTPGSAYGLQLVFNSKDIPHLAFDDGSRGPSRLQSSVMKYVSGRWVYVGRKRFSGEKSKSTDLSIVFDKNDNLFAAYSNLDNGVVVKQFKNNRWRHIGQNSLNKKFFGALAPIVIGSSGTPLIIFRNTYREKNHIMFEIIALQYSGNQWVPVGNLKFKRGDELGYIDSAVDSNNTPYILYAEDIKDQYYYSHERVLARKLVK